MDIYQEFKNKLPEGHLNKLKEMVLHGADPVYLGPKKGYKPKPYPGTDSVEMLALWDYFALVKASRAIVFNLEEEGMLEALIQAGVHNVMSPIVAAHKKQAHGALAVDEWGDLILRMCNDCSHNGHAS